MPSRETMAAQAAGDSSLGSFHDGAGEDVGFWFLVAARTRIGEWQENGHHGAGSHAGSGKAGHVRFNRLISYNLQYFSLIKNQLQLTYQPALIPADQTQDDTERPQCKFHAISDVLETV